MSIRVEMDLETCTWCAARFNGAFRHHCKYSPAGFHQSPEGLAKEERGRGVVTIDTQARTAMIADYVAKGQFNVAEPLLRQTMREAVNNAESMR